MRSKDEPYPLQEELLKLNTRLSEVVVQNLEVLEDRQLVWYADAQSWSISTCIQHLNLVLDFYQEELEQIIRTIKSKKRPISSLPYKSSWWGKKSIRRVQLGSSNKVTKKLKTTSELDPLKEPLTLCFPRKIIRNYLDRQALLDEILSLVSVEELYRIKIKSPQWTWLKMPLGDVLKYIIYHQERHLVQAQQLRYSELLPIRQKQKK